MPSPNGGGDGRSPDLRVTASPNLPGRCVQWSLSGLLSAYSCGGSRGLGSVSVPHRVPFSSRTRAAREPSGFGYFKRAPPVKLQNGTPPRWRAFRQANLAPSPGSPPCCAALSQASPRPDGKCIGGLGIAQYGARTQDVRPPRTARRRPGIRVPRMKGLRPLERRHHPRPPQGHPLHSVCAPVVC